MRTVCLCTPLEDPIRFARAQQHFEEVGLGPVEYFHGLHKSTSGLDSSHTYMVDRGPDSPDANVPYHMGAHPVNIWIGHYMTWQALKLSGDEAWLILETDTKFPDGHDAKALVETAVSQVESLDPNYDLLYIGSCACAGQHRVNRRMYNDSVGHRALATIYGSGPQCNHGYVLKAKAVASLEQMRKIWAPIDIQQTSECFEHGQKLPQAVPVFQPIFPKLTVYAVLPRIVEQFDTIIEP